MSNPTFSKANCICSIRRSYTKISFAACSSSKNSNLIGNTRCIFCSFQTF